MRLIFMGNPSMAVGILSSLIEGGQEIVAVYTSPDKPVGRGQRIVSPAVKVFAQENRLEIHQPENFKQPSEIDRLISYKPDAIIVAAFGRLLPESVISLPPYGCINIHPSLLPRWRGPSPLAAAILAGDSWSGVSIMRLDEGMDSGPLLNQAKIPITDFDTSQSLGDKLFFIASCLLPEVLNNEVTNSIQLQHQDDSQATFSHKIKKEDGMINWSEPATTIWRKIRAFQPWPGTWTRWQDTIIKVRKARPITGAHGKPGMVIALPQAELAVVTGEGALAIELLQLEGKRVMSATDFIHGKHTFAGSLLG
jgi:methionyl-tRNA formyltransferase